MEHTESAASPPAALDPFEGVEETFNEANIRATRRFLAHEGHGVTEVRVISPGRGITGIGYFDDEDAFVTACAKASGTGNVYVGIQPRPARFLAQAPNRLAHLRVGAHDQDIEQVTAIVMDLDPVRPKDTASTEEELAQAVSEATRLADWLAAKGMVRPVRVMSGNGCHLWLAVPPICVEQAGRDELTERLKAFEAKVRGQVTSTAVKLDSIYNLSRIIKVAGTLSVKGEPTPERPHRLSRPLGRFVRQEDELLRRAILAMPVSLAQHPALAENEDEPVKPGAELSPRVRSLLTSSPRLLALFEGRGKTAVGDDGRRLDTTSSGYDFSFVLGLVHRGVTDPRELATALWHRPDGAARAKGEKYVAKTVQHALVLAAKSKPQGQGQPVGLDFEVSRVVVLDSNPPVYHLTVDGEVLVLSSAELLSEYRFKKRFVEVLQRIPRLPSGLNKDEPTFEQHVNEWLKKAEVVHQPPEASRRGMLEEELRLIIDGLGEAEGRDDLDRGKALLVEGRRAFKTRNLARAVKDSSHVDLGTHELCDLLRSMGCTSRVVSLDGGAVRLWVAPECWPEETPEPPSPSAQPGASVEVGGGA